MTSLVLLVCLLPLLGAVAAIAQSRPAVIGAATIAGGAGSFAAAIVLAARIAGRGHFQALGGFVYVDALGAFFAVTVSFVVLLASLGSAAYVGAEHDRRHLSAFQVRLYFGFFSLFASGMLGAFLVGNLGLLWVLIETSTLASAALVGLEGESRSLEAAWKYVIISSLGITIALVATVFLFYSGTGLHLSSNQRLTWSYLFVHAHGLTPAPMRLAFLLAVVGYGTKVGLAPMHTWLPDAHSEAPSPASAMLSAALLTTGMYAIIRFEAIAKVALGASYPQTVLLFFGFLSVFIGVMFLVPGGNYKRLFAYSSVEHMGVVAVALGFGGTLGLYGALFQILTHAVGKAVLFLSTGHVVLGYRTRESSQVRGALGALPLAGGVLLVASLGVAGSPPFGVFLSELTIVRAGFSGAEPVLAGLLLVFLAVGFVSLIATTLPMVSGDPPSTDPIVAYPTRAGRLAASTPLVAGLGVFFLLGVWVPSGLDQLLMASVKAIT